MATVPKSQRQVQATRGPVVFQENQQISAPAGAFGTGGAAMKGLSQAAAGGADLIQQVAMDKLAEDNTRMVKEGDIAYSTAIRELGYGTPQKPGGFYSTRGQNTLDGHAEASAQMEKARQEILKKYGTAPRVRAKLDLITQTRQESEAGQMAVFGETQRRVANDDVSEARVGMAVADAAARATAPDGPEVFAQSLRVVQQEVFDTAERNGTENPLQIQAAMTERTSALVKASFDVLKVSDPMAAKVFFEAHKEQLVDPRLWGKFESDIKVAVQREGEQVAFATILEQFPGDISAQLKAAKSLPPELQDGVRDRIQDEGAQAIRTQKAKQAKNFDDAWSTAVKNEGRTDSVDPEILASLNPTQRNALRTFRQQLAEDGSGFALVNNADVYNELATMDLDELSKVELRAPHYLSNLTDQSWQKFQDRRSNWLKQKADAGGGKSSMRTTNQVRTDFLKNYGLEGEQAQLFSEEMDDAITAYEDRTGETADSAFVQKVGEGLFSRDPARWYESTGETYMSHETEKLRSNFDLSQAVIDNPDGVAAAAGVPAAELPALLEGLAEIRPPVAITFDNIKRLYNKANATKQ